MDVQRQPSSLKAVNPRRMTSLLLTLEGGRELPLCYVISQKSTDLGFKFNSDQIQ
jgi:hypothetical protein